MSGTFPFFRLSFWAKFDSKTPVFTPSDIKICEFESLTRAPEENFVDNIVCFGKQLFAYFPPERISLVRGILFNLKLWKRLHCNCLSLQTLFVVHRSRSEVKLFHVETNGYWREGWWFLWVVASFQMPVRLLLASKSLVLERAIALRFAFFSRDVFLLFVGFLWEDLQCNRRETGWTLLVKTEWNNFCICEKMNGTPGE